MSALGERWARDCAALVRATGRPPPADATGRASAAGPEVGADLLHRWAEPHRRYHGTTHLTEVLSAIDTLGGTEALTPRAQAVAVFAGWFHDAVYEIGADTPAGAPNSNEERSAALARRSLERMGVDRPLVTAVADGILGTATHDLGPPSGRDAAHAVVNDADLWILAAPAGRFDEYCAQVRAEYAHVPPQRYARARALVLEPLLARPHIYATAWARATWEPLARENLARELSRLGA